MEKPGRTGLQELAAEADTVFYSKGWAQASTLTFTSGKSFPLFMLTMDLC